MAVKYAVRIQHRDYDAHKVVEELLCIIRILLEKVYQSTQNVGTRGFPRVHPACDKQVVLVGKLISAACRCVLKQTRVLNPFFWLVFFQVQVRGNGDHFDLPLLQRERKEFSVKIN